MYCSSPTHTYYLRHYFGKCLEYDANRQVFVYAEICREKFKWSSGARLVHMPTSRCLSVNSTADGSYLALASNCNSTSSLFQYNEASSVIIHLISGKCLAPESGPSDPSSKIPVVIKAACTWETNKYWFRPTAYYEIRHFSGLCWHNKDSYIKLLKVHNCDRFYYENDYRLRHVKSQNCVTLIRSGSNDYLTLTADCQSVTDEFKVNGYSVMENSKDNCIHPEGGELKPSSDTQLIANLPCKNEDRSRTLFYEEKGMIHDKLTNTV